MHDSMHIACVKLRYRFLYERLSTFLALDLQPISTLNTIVNIELICFKKVIFEMFLKTQYTSCHICHNLEF